MKKFLKKKSMVCTIFSILMVGLVFTGCTKASASNDNSSSNTTAEAAKNITVTDVTGKKVEIPSKVNRIADGWGAHNAIVAMLGGADKIVANSLDSKVKPWLYKVNPSMSKSVRTFSYDTNDVNMEELIKTNPDVVFLNQGNKTTDKISKMGVPVVQVNFKDFDSLKKCVQLTGEVLGTNGKKMADEYITYLNGKLSMLNKVVSKIPEDKKPKVLHLADVAPLKVDGKQTIIDSWINAAGGINAADFDGASKEVSFEQILKWNPDIIIVSGTVGSATDRVKDTSEIFKDPKWQQINAVKNGKTYVNPDGSFSWDRYSAEEALQIQWAAKKIQPDLFKNIDMVKETREFYKTFFKYNLSEDEANRILNGQAPPTK